jgi:hypothetical protein
MKTLWILAAAAMFAACAKGSDEEVGAAPDRGDTTGVTTQVDTATGQWDTTGATGDVNAQPGDTLSMPADTGMTPTTPTDTTVGQYPTPSDTTGYGGAVDTTMTAPTSPDTGAYVPDTGAAGVDTSGMDSGMGTDTTTSPSEPSVPADPGAEDPNQAQPQ